MKPWRHNKKALNEKQELEKKKTIVLLGAVLMNSWTLKILALIKLHLIKLTAVYIFQLSPPFCLA